MNLLRWRHRQDICIDIGWVFGRKHVRLRATAHLAQLRSVGRIPHANCDDADASMPKHLGLHARLKARCCVTISYHNH
jgi:hypothetical protein